MTKDKQLDRSVVIKKPIAKLNFQFFQYESEYCLEINLWAEDQGGWIQ